MRRTETVTVGFIGAGRLTWSLAAAMARADYRVAAVASRDFASAAALASGLGAQVQPTTSEQVLDAAELVFLAVQDAMIAPLAASLPWQAHHLAVHCSGALELDVLAPAVAAGGRVGCLHPLQSFPGRSAEPDRFRGITCGVEGAEPLGSLLEEIVAVLGARTLRLEGVDRALYHAAAVFASNDAVALISAARRAWAMAGLPAGTAREALAPLLVAVAQNVSVHELSEALTGPIARGDIYTVEAHLSALSADPELADLYRMLGAELLKVGAPADPMTREALARLLERL